MGSTRTREGVGPSVGDKTGVGVFVETGATGLSVTIIAVGVGEDVVVEVGREVGVGSLVVAGVGSGVEVESVEQPPTRTYKTTARKPALLVFPRMPSSLVSNNRSYSIALKRT